MVTVARALAHAGFTEVAGFSDPTALPMLPPTWRLATRLLLRRVASRPAARAKAFERSDGRLDLMALRTRVLDEAWHAAGREGTRQLVLLGAGLDGRAFRLDDLDDVAVFEVDHPATQALKRRRARAMSPDAPSTATFRSTSSATTWRTRCERPVTAPKPAPSGSGKA